MALYTGNGDSGYSSLIAGEKKSKDSLEFTVLGKLDELQAFLYKCLLYVPEGNSVIKAVIKDIVMVNSRIAGADITSLLEDLNSRIHEMERYMDANENKIQSLEGFVGPNLADLSTQINLARVKAREVERVLVNYFSHKGNKEEKVILTYFNRLSDYLFVLMLED